MKFAALTLALASTAFGQSLIQVINSTSQLSGLSSIIGPYEQQFANLTNVTLLAPDNSAVNAFLNSSTAGALSQQASLAQAILLYHVIQGNYSNITDTSFLPTSLLPPQYTNVTGGQRVEAVRNGQNITFFSGLLQNSSVVNASIPFSGGTIHIIDQFLTIPQNISSTGVALNLTSAVGATRTLNLSETLDNTPDLTCFLPNNAAFARIGGNLANLTTENLTSLLSYHVIPGLYYSTNITNGSSVQTLDQGSNITLRIEGNSTYVNGAKVVIPNVLVANGVVHVIDAVLNPANSTQVPNTATTEDAFAGATSASEQPFTSGVPTPTSSIATESATSVQGGHSSSSSSGVAWRPIETGAMGMAALFGGAAAVMNM